MIPEKLGECVRRVVEEVVRRVVKGVVRGVVRRVVRGMTRRVGGGIVRRVFEVWSAEWSDEWSHELVRRRPGRCYRRLTDCTEHCQDRCYLNTSREWTTLSTSETKQSNKETENS